MPLISIWECPKTGELFRDKAEYRNHLRGIVRQRAYPAYRRVARLEFNTAFAHAKQTISSFEELEDFYNRMIPTLIRRNTYPYDSSGLPIPVDFKLAFNTMRWSRRVYPSRSPDPTNAEHSGWMGRMIFTGNFKPWSPYMVFSGQVGLTICNAISKQATWRAPVTYEADVTVFDADFPNIAFVERMAGRLDPNANMDF